MGIYQEREGGLGEEGGRERERGRGKKGRYGEEGGGGGWGGEPDRQAGRQTKRWDKTDRGRLTERETD